MSNDNKPLDSHGNNREFVVGWQQTDPKFWHRGYASRKQQRRFEDKPTKVVGKKRRKRAA
jgi:hypothetical protein